MGKRNRKLSAEPGIPAGKLPQEVEAELERLGIRGEDVLVSVRTDMDLTCAFTPGWIVLAKGRLITATADPLSGEVHYFKGMETRTTRAVPKDREWTFAEYDISDLKKTYVERSVSGGFLVLVHRDPDDPEAEGLAETVAAVSNRCMSSATKIERLCGKLAEGKEIDEESLQEDEEEEYCPVCGMMYPNPDRKVCPRCMNKKSIFRRTLGYLKPYRGRILVMFLCYLVTALLNIVWPYLNGVVLYKKVLEKDESFLRFFSSPFHGYAMILLSLVLTMVMTKLTMQLVGILQGVMTARIVPRVVRTMRNDVFGAMGKLSINFFTSKQTGSLMTRVMSDSDEVSGFFIDGLPYFLINVFSIVAMAVVMFSLSVPLAIVALMFMPVAFLVSWRMLPRLWHRYGRRHRATRSLNSKIHDNLSGARVVKAFGQEGSEVQRFDKSNAKVRSADLAVMNYDNKFSALYSAAENLASLMVYIVGAYLILIQRRFDYAVLITFAGYVGQLTGPMDFMSFFFRWFTNCMNSAQRMFEIIDAVPEISEKEDAVSLDTIQGTVEMKDVTFGYEKNKPVLKNISLRVEGGHMLGIVGRSGAGKTTIVNLISRLYDPQEGSVTLDGVDLKDLSFRTLRGNVAMVSQETYMFMGTVADNIAYAKKDASRAEIIRAAVLASAHDFICRMPDGYDTIIGSSGRELSGGERQRISIARAILADPRILILDEATAAVDTETEQAIQESINLLIKGRTTISIAHRLSTLRDADTLIVIDDGKIAEEGTHEELIAKKGVYYKLKELQTKALALKGIE